MFAEKVVIITGASSGLGRQLAHDLAARRCRVVLFARNADALAEAAKVVPILLVEQNTSMALELASRGYVFELGDVVLQGPAEELLGNQALVAAYLGGGAAAPTASPPHAGS